MPICDLCGLDRKNLKAHRGTQPCQAQAEANRVGRYGLVPIKGALYEVAALRVALEQHRVLHEVAAAVYESSRPAGWGSGWKSGRRNALCVPTWVRCLWEAMTPFPEVMEPLWWSGAIGRALKLGEEFRAALETVGALGGKKAVVRTLREEGFLDASPSIPR